MEIKVKDNQIEEIYGISPAYPYVFHHTNLRDTKVPWHWHEELEFGYVREGNIKLDTPNKSCHFGRNEAFFINTNVLCTMMTEEGADCGILDSHLFHPVFLGGHFKSLISTKYLEPILQNGELEILEIRGDNRNQTEILAKLKRLSQLQNTADMELQTRNILSEIWNRLFVEVQDMKLGSYGGKQISQERIQTMMSFIRHRYMEKLSLEEIAASASVSKRECLRCFRKCLGKTPHEYLMDIRIDMAQKYLKESDMPILEIALQTGFANGAYFGKIFKQMCDLPPGEYRKKIKKKEHAQHY